LTGGSAIPINWGTGENSKGMGSEEDGVSPLRKGIWDLSPATPPQMDEKELWDFAV